MSCYQKAKRHAFSVENEEALREATEAADLLPEKVLWVMGVEWFDVPSSQTFVRAEVSFDSGDYRCPDVFYLVWAKEYPAEEGKLTSYIRTNYPLANQKNPS